MHPPLSQFLMDSCQNGRLTPTAMKLSQCLESERNCSEDVQSKCITFQNLAPACMREEVFVAVQFLLRVFHTPQLIPFLPQLGRNLSQSLASKYKGHWFAEKPHKGQAFRCIQMARGCKLDKTLHEAVTASGLQISQLRIPVELFIWVDPLEVTCRFGGDLGSFLPIYSNDKGKILNFVDKFDFDRLCSELPAATASTYSGRGNLSTGSERAVLTRVVPGGVDREIVVLERGITVPVTTSNTFTNLQRCPSTILTPPTTPPQSPSSSSPLSTSPPPDLHSSSPSPPTAGRQGNGFSMINRGRGQQGSPYNAYQPRSSPSFHSVSPTSHQQFNYQYHQNILNNNNNLANANLPQLGGYGSSMFLSSGQQSYQARSPRHSKQNKWSGSSSNIFGLTSCEINNNFAPQHQQLQQEQLFLQQKREEARWQWRRAGRV